MTIDEYLTARNKTQAWFAGILGVSEMTVSRYVRDPSSITAERAVAIEVATDGFVPRYETRPDLWPKPAAAKRARKAGAR